MTVPDRPASPVGVSPRPPLRRVVAWASLAAALVSLAPRGAGAGHDDFEFGQVLIQRGYPEYARRVFESIVADEKRSQPDRDKARYGMALLGKADAIVAINNPATPWSDAIERLDKAISSIEDFVRKFPDDAQADQARVEMSGLQQWFVEQSADLATDPDRLKERGTDAAQVLEAATRNADRAIATYKWLMANAKTPNVKELAKYYLAVMGYYRALTAPKCSPQQLEGLKQAQRTLDDYAFDNDGRLTQVFAQDYQGQALWAIGDCEQGKTRWATYHKALSMFIACADTEDQGEDHRRAIALGYYHIGRLANAVARTDDVRPGESAAVSDTEARAFLREARRKLVGIERVAAQSRLDRMDHGLRAFVEWGLIEWRLGDTEAAIKIINRASEQAAANSLPGVVARANAALGRVASGTGLGGDPAVLFKVAEDLRARDKLFESVAAYQKVIASAPLTSEGLRRFVYPSWFAVAQAYRKMNLLLEAAAAYEAILDEEAAGRLTPERADDATKQLVRNTFEQQRGVVQAVADRTGDPADRRRREEVNKRVIARQPAWVGEAGAGAVSDLAYRTAMEQFREGLRLREEAKAAPEAWQKPVRESRQYYTETTKTLASEWQDAAYVYLGRIDFELGQFEEALKGFAAARAFWATEPARKKLEGGDARIVSQRRAQAAAADYWEARALVALNRQDQALPILVAFPTKHADAKELIPVAVGLRCEILADQGKVAEAEVAYSDLLRLAPDYPKIPVIVARLARHYLAQTSEVQKQIDAVNAELAGPPADRAAGLRARRLAAEKEEITAIGRVADLNDNIARLEAWLEQTKDPEFKFEPKEKERKEKELAEATENRKKALVSLAESRARAAELAKRIDELTTERARLQLAQVPSMRRSAELYEQLDEAYRKMDAASGGGSRRRTADDLGSLAYRYYLLAKNDPTSTNDLAKARDLFEAYFALPDVKALPETHQNKRIYSRIAGDIWYRLAEQAAAADEARLAYQKALVYLEPYAARSPVNAAICRRVLRGEVAVLRATDARGTDWPVPVRKSENVKVFREDLKNHGGDLLPRYADANTQSDFEKAVTQLKNDLQRKSDTELAPIVASLKNAGFDRAFWVAHGVNDNEFLLSLARCYARSGQAEDALGAVGAARAVLEVPPQALTDGAEWWEAQTIYLETFVALAERRAAAAAQGGPNAAELKKEAERFVTSAAKSISFNKAIYPKIGGAERHEVTLKEWEALQARMLKVASALGVKDVKAEDLRRIRTLDAAPPESPGR